jgi:hypothetical protein
LDFSFLLVIVEQIIEGENINIRMVPIDQINAAAYNPQVDLQLGDPEYEKL